MATFSFREFSAIQSIITNKHQFGKDELIFTLDGNDAQVTIVENEDDKATFVLYKDVAQELVDWLKEKGFVS